jgi:hypothetical protein
VHLPAFRPQVRTARLPASTFKVASSHFLDSDELHRWLAEYQDGILADAGARGQLLLLWLSAAAALVAGVPAAQVVAAPMAVLVACSSA